MIELKDLNIKDIIVIDCEASGLKEKSYPIEVGGGGGGGGGVYFFFFYK